MVFTGHFRSIVSVGAIAAIRAAVVAIVLFEGSTTAAVSTLSLSNGIIIIVCATNRSIGVDGCCVAMGIAAFNRCNNSSIVTIVVATARSAAVVVAVIIAVVYSLLRNVLTYFLSFFWRASSMHLCGCMCVMLQHYVRSRGGCLQVQENANNPLRCVRASMYTLQHTRSCIHHDKSSQTRATKNCVCHETQYVCICTYVHSI